MLREFFRYYNFLAQFWILVILNLLDFCLTRPAVLLFGPEAEGNPFLRHQVEQHGVNAILWWKLAMLAVLWAILWAFGPMGAHAGQQQKRIRIAWIIAGCNFWYAGVVFYGVYCWLHV